MLADIREGVHLRSLGTRRIRWMSSTARRSRRSGSSWPTPRTRRWTTFDEAEIDRGLDPADDGLSRPSATWTYMVHDNPFGSEMERFLVNSAKLLFGRK